MNPILIQSYQLGVALGVIILSTLILFPGTNQSNSDADDASTAGTDTTGTYSVNTVTPLERPAVSTEETKGSVVVPSKSNSSNDVDAPNFLSPHRRLNWMVYLWIYTVMTLVLFYSYNSNLQSSRSSSRTGSTLEYQEELPLYRRQLQSPTKLLQLTLEAYFPKEASLLFSSRKPTKRPKTNQRS
jgi:hypothetical protein